MKKVDYFVFYKEDGTAMKVPPITDGYDNGNTYVESNTISHEMVALDKSITYEQFVKYRERQARKGLGGIFFPPINRGEDKQESEEK